MNKFEEKMLDKLVDRDISSEILSYIKNLIKKAELGEHYKHLYSEVKKQKDDVIEYIKTLEIYGYDENAYYIRDLHNKGLYLEELPEVLLRMLGEIDE